ncbi:MAG TPA: hypothetical protein VHF87_14780 [Methylomirabilota bacterium]|jgi:hypothetical protein|nr:hypothetical protein [Methylomirabilota bacterium]
MSRIGRIGVLVLALGVVGGLGSAGAADAPSRTFNAPVDRVWAVTESVLKSLGWEIDQSDRTVGWILTDSRGVDFKDYAVYGKGLRHKLRVALKAAGEGRTTVTVERELYTEERILWMTERKPVTATEQNVETAVLDAIQQAI